jgi:hypothetical protein
MQNLSVQNPVPFHVEIYCVDHSPLFYTRAVAVERAVSPVDVRLFAGLCTFCLFCLFSVETQKSTSAMRSTRGPRLTGLPSLGQ